MKNPITMAAAYMKNIVKEFGSTGKTDEELLTKNPEATELIEIKEIEDTPFTAVRHEKDWFLMMGKYRLTEALTSEEECKEASKDASWWRIMSLMQVMITESEDVKKICDRLETMEKMQGMLDKATEIVKEEKDQTKLDV